MWKGRRSATVPRTPAQEALLRVRRSLSPPAPGGKEAVRGGLPRPPSPGGVRAALAAVGPRSPFGVRVPSAAGPGPGHIGSPPGPPGLFPPNVAVCRAAAVGPRACAQGRAAGQSLPVSRAEAGPGAEYRRSGPLSAQLGVG